MGKVNFCRNNKKYNFNSAACEYRRKLNFNDVKRALRVAVSLRIIYNLILEKKFHARNKNSKTNSFFGHQNLKMIAHLAGKILLKQATSVIVDVNGVGYEVTIPLSTAYELGEAGADVSLRIYTLVREDALSLFGFQTGRERELFTLLISVSGIGAKSAIAMLSSMTADEIAAAIRTNNLARLTSVPGIGRKTAERLVIELRDKIIQLSSPALEEMVAANGKAAKPSIDTVYDDALEALVSLGYAKPVAERTLKTTMSDGGEISVEALLRRSLRNLSK